MPRGVLHGSCVAFKSACSVRTGVSVCVVFYVWFCWVSYAGWGVGGGGLLMGLLWTVRVYDGC